MLKFIQNFLIIMPNGHFLQTLNKLFSLTFLRLTNLFGIVFVSFFEQIESAIERMKYDTKLYKMHKS